ncbi:MAG: type II secretion system protein [Kiritimatiellia bacterium]
MKRTNQAGFTLVELLTVIAIIALLAALILGLAGNAQKSAARSKAEAEIEQLSVFITDYQMKYGQVPPTYLALSNALMESKHALTNLLDSWGMAYSYTSSSKATFYLWSYGGDLPPYTNKAIWIGNPKP